jgi:hypothetical protein
VVLEVVLVVLVALVEVEELVVGLEVVVMAAAETAVAEMAAD